MPNPQNIKPPKKGEVRNPNGRPAGSKNRATIARMILESAVHFPDELVEKVQQIFPEFSKKTTGEIAATYMQLVKAVTDKDTLAYKTLMDSAYGAPKQEVEHSGDEQNPIKFTITKTYAAKPEPDEGD